VTPGAGVRVQTPVGPIRFDVAYNGYRRPSGPAYFEEGLGEEGDAERGGFFCVSPDNLLNVGGEAPTGSCPATFTPPEDAGLFHRLTFHFSIGQAF
jgi:outer membrane protein assembly factor BamA